ncbi:DUF4135 domain-containing protein [Synechococcus sp. MIT S1220]|uniref:DUF4135 domain-containing protein n=1 Tax=Synechococcus sp. MIT S1220 TaxID=3082549 RepID=UPI0039AF9B22
MHELFNFDTKEEENIASRLSKIYKTSTSNDIQKRIQAIKINAIDGNNPSDEVNFRSSKNADNIKEPREIQFSIYWKILNEISIALRSDNEQNNADHHLSKQLGEDQEIAFIDIWLPVKKLFEEKLMSELDQKELDNSLLNARDVIILAASHEFIHRAALIGESLLLQNFQNYKLSNEDQHQFQKDTTDQTNKAQAHASRIKYNSFVRKVKNNGMKEIFQEYPLFGRVLSSIFLDLLTNFIRLIDRINNDLSEIRYVFCLSSESQLMAISKPLSDYHNGAQSVRRITFSSTSKAINIMYKPRNISAELYFNNFLKYLNKHDKDFKFVTYETLCKSDYGYVEYISEDINRNLDLEKYHYNCGRLSSILWILGATDCHKENFIINKDQPIFLDCETLMQPQFCRRENYKSKEEHDFNNSIENSIVKTSFLPAIMSNTKLQLSQPMSAFEVDFESSSEVKNKRWHKINTDKMNRILSEYGKRAKLLKKSSAHSLNILDRHIDHLIKGFEHQSYQIIHLKNQKQLSFNKQCSEFKTIRTRFIMRPTAIYAHLLDQLFSANILKNDPDASFYLERLFIPFIKKVSDSYLSIIVNSEIKQLLRLDIPLLQASATSDALISPIINAHIFGLSGFENFQARLKNLSRPEIEKNSKLIRMIVEEAKDIFGGIALIRPTR